MVTIILLTPRSEYTEVLDVLLINTHGIFFLLSHTQFFKLSALKLDVINIKKIFILNSTKHPLLTNSQISGVYLFNADVNFSL